MSATEKCQSDTGCKLWLRTTDRLSETLLPNPTNQQRNSDANFCVNLLLFMLMETQKNSIYVSVFSFSAILLLFQYVYKQIERIILETLAQSRETDLVTVSRKQLLVLLGILSSHWLRNSKRIFCCWPGCSFSSLRPAE